MTSRPASPALGMIASAAAMTAIVGIWVSRVFTSESAYVSEMGAAGAPMATVFNLSLVLVGVAAFLVERSLHAHPVVHAHLLPQLGGALLIGGLMFVVAATVTCTEGCPVPFTAGSTVQDFIHIASAVLGFGAALAAMVITGFAGRSRWVRTVSLGGALAVLVTASTGALIALFDGPTWFGGWLEFVATTIAIVWLALLAWHLSRLSRRRPLTAARLSRMW
ncbi:hypothetical protein GCM10009847_02290 [Leucobacter tardus]|uniref:DUF998 domain-containing protein n=1 Tax=Leucobacter tardus TaxID=501483 RepID=A0A939TT95_9MICO|nr:DUF998 domain-containing protein [Leucobacter tardus]MBO2988440.1 DUF998 domain-containing protein [Leucobacter tardus]